MDLKVFSIDIRDNLQLLAKTAQVELRPGAVVIAPPIEFQLESESTYTTPTALRTNDQAVFLKLATDGNAPAVIFKGLVDYVDDLKDPNTITARIDMSALPPGRAHKRRATAIYNSTAALNYAGGEALAGPRTLANLTDYSSVDLDFSINFANPTHGGSISAKAIIKDFCGKLGLAVRALAFPDYQINGTYVAEHKTAVEVIQDLLAPLNMFPYLQYVVRIYGNDLSVIDLDFTKTGHPDPFICKNIKSIKRSYRAYEADNQVGANDIVLTGGVSPSAIEPAYSVTQRDIPQDVELGLPATTSFELGSVMQEMLVTDTVTTVSASKQFQDDNLSNGPGSPAAGGTEASATAVVEVASYVLVSGYGADLSAKAITANLIYTRLIAFVTKLQNMPQTSKAGYMLFYYPLEDDTQRLARFDQLLGAATSKRDAFKSIAAGLNKIINTTGQSSISGTDVSGSGLAKISSESDNIQYIYDVNGNPVSATLTPSVVFGGVDHVSGISVLGSQTNKSVTTQTQNGVIISKVEVTNAYIIKDYGFENKLLLTESIQTTYSTQDGKELRPRYQDVKKYFFDAYGDVIQTITYHYTLPREAATLYDVTIEMTPKQHIDYALRAFEDEKRELAVSEKYVELGVTQNDVSNTVIEQRKTPSGDGPIPSWSNIAVRYSVDRTETNRRNKLKYYMLVNGVPMTDDVFYRSMPVEFIRPVLGALDIFNQTQDALDKTSNGIRDIITDPPHYTPVGFKQSMPLMNYDGLKGVQTIINGQRDLERKGSYWEDTTVEMTLDTTPVVGGYAIAQGATGRIVDVWHHSEADRATTTVRLLKLVKNA